MEKGTKGVGISLILKVLIVVLFIIYIAALFKILILRSASLHTLLQQNNRFRSVNLVPFKTIAAFFLSAKEMGYMRAVSNILGNIIIFIPFGYMLPVIFKKSTKFLVLLLEVIIFSVLIETFQYVFGVGSSDIDDVILNALGGIMGYFIYNVISRFKLKKSNFYAIIVIITCVMLTGGYIVAKRQFSAELGMSKIHEKIIGRQDMPKTKADMIGKIIGKSRKAIILKEDMQMIAKNKKNSSGMDAKSKAGVERKTSKMTILIYKNTKFYSVTSSLKGNNMTSTYKKVKYQNIDSLVRRGRNVIIWEKNHKASTVCVIK